MITTARIIKTLQECFSGSVIVDFGDLSLPLFSGTIPVDALFLYVNMQCGYRFDVDVNLKVNRTNCQIIHTKRMGRFVDCYKINGDFYLRV